MIINNNYYNYHCHFKWYKLLSYAEIKNNTWHYFLQNNQMKKFIEKFSLKIEASEA